MFEKYTINKGYNYSGSLCLPLAPFPFYSRFLFGGFVAGIMLQCSAVVCHRVCGVLAHLCVFLFPVRQGVQEFHQSCKCELAQTLHTCLRVNSSILTFVIKSGGN